MIVDVIAQVAEQAGEWRRDLHAHPELLYDLPRTSAFVARLLREFGCDMVEEGIGGSGVVATVKGASGSSDRSIGIRADMDALPILEATEVSHASVHSGKMHACGHDGHTAILLGAAKHLARTRDFEGRVVLVFQPAEEGGAGAAAMIRDGLMDRFAIDEIYGLHNTPGLPVGQFAIRPGAIQAAGDRIEIDVTGRGGHAAHPEVCVDTILVASQIVNALQSVVSRSIDPLEPAVVTVTAFAAGTNHNSIPQTARLLGTVRTFSAASRDLAERRIREIAKGIAEAYGGKAEVRFIRCYPATINHPVETDHLARAAAEIGTVEETKPHMGAEDFSFMLQERPGAFIFLGNGASADLHNPTYDFNDDAIPYGIGLWTALVRQRLAFC